MATQTASASIPALWRFLLLNIEPACTLGGIYLLLFNPAGYTSPMSRNALASPEAASAFIYTELAGGWAHLAFTEAVVLRIVDDLRVWKLTCMAILLSDIAFCHSCAQALGGWSEWIQVGDWSVNEWAVIIGTLPFILARLAIVFGIGEKTKVR